MENVCGRGQASTPMGTQSVFDDLPASCHKASQQLCPQVLIVRLYHQIQILILAAIEVIFLRYISSSLVGNLNGQHRFGDGLGVAIVVGGCDLHFMKFLVGRVPTSIDPCKTCWQKRLSR